MGQPQRTVNLQARIEEERSRWFWIPRESLGLVLSSVEELEKKFPVNNSFGKPFRKELQDFHEEVVIDNPGFHMYMRYYLGNIIHGIAYGCHSCNKIVVGPPKIELARDGQSMQFYCTNCLSPIQKLPIKVD